ncbi:hypothetical protein ZIOFF_043622 [Zingiber officinale]|uniref:Dynein light chain n=1 Tax=Zingiber officinale TaxID=94328 RepID=A0A8J5G0Q3_ZINOF|nr:hypothetical protein ZIOFF_043622 [Zingiber officinale]
MDFEGRIWEIGVSRLAGGGKKDTDYARRGSVNNSKIEGVRSGDGGIGKTVVLSGMAEDELSPLLDGGQGVGTNIGASVEVPEREVPSERTEGGKSNHGNAKACDNLAFDRSFVVFSSSRGMLDSLQEKKKTMRGVAKSGASEELERRSQYLSSLIQRTRISEDGDQVKKEVVKAEVKPMRREQQRKQEGDEEEEKKKKKGVREVDQCDDNPSLEQQQQKTPIVKVRAADMPVALQKRAFRCAHEMLASMPKLESKRLAFALKKASTFPSKCVFVSCVCFS